MIGTAVAFSSKIYLLKKQHNRIRVGETGRERKNESLSTRQISTAAKAGPGQSQELRIPSGSPHIGRWYLNTRAIFTASSDASAGRWMVSRVARLLKLAMGSASRASCLPCGTTKVFVIICFFQ